MKAAGYTTGYLHFVSTRLYSHYILYRVYTSWHKYKETESLYIMESFIVITWKQTEMLSKFCFFGEIIHQ